jgi:hypothetical protein
MVISSPEFIVNSYRDWYERLIVKNKENIYLSNMQDISLMGMIRKIVGNPNLPNLPFILGGMIMMGLCYLRISMYKVEKFRLLLLSSVLMTRRPICLYPITLCPFVTLGFHLMGELYGSGGRGALLATPPPFRC